MTSICMETAAEYGMEISSEKSKILINNIMPKIKLQGSLDGRRRRGGPRKSWKDNIKDWTDQAMSPLLCVAEDRRRWAAVTAEAAVGIPKQRLGVAGFD